MHISAKLAIYFNVKSLIWKNEPNRHSHIRIQSGLLFLPNVAFVQFAGKEVSPELKFYVLEI